MDSPWENPHPSQVKEFTSVLENDSEDKVKVSVRKRNIYERTSEIILPPHEIPKNGNIMIEGLACIPGEDYEFRFDDHAKSRILSIT